MAEAKRRSKAGSSRSSRRLVRLTSAAMPVRVMPSGSGRRSTALVAASIKFIFASNLTGSHADQRPYQPPQKAVRFEMGRGGDQADAVWPRHGHGTMIEPAIGLAEIARRI